MMKTIVDWANANEGFIALLTFILISILVPLLRMMFKSIDSKVSRSVSEDEIRRVEKLRAEFYTNLEHIDADNGYGPFLIRDVARDKIYFDGDEGEFKKKGAPPSFKVQVEGMSVHGVRVYQGWPEYVKKIVDDDTWCLADKEDEGAILVHPIAIIPFSAIVAVNWHGDPATLFPHIFCRFECGGGWPYKTVEYCESTVTREGWDLYVPHVEATKVIRHRY